MIVYPFRRWRLNGLNQLGHRFRRIHSYKQMHMIGHTIDGINKMIPIFTSPCNITK